MTIVARTDKLGWNIVIPTTTGTTVRFIIQCEGGFMVVNGFCRPGTSIFQSTFRGAVRLARAGNI